MSDSETPTDDGTDPFAELSDDAEGRERAERQDPDPDAIDTLAAEIDARDVWDSDTEQVTVYETITHRNDDTTVILISSFSGVYQAFVYEVSAAGDLLATEEIGAAEQGKRIAAQCEYWLQQHPKGILAPEADDEGGLFGGFELGGLFGGGDA